ncbi:MAG: hypothetical protein HYR88_14765 [Verrucomicrobia bacterium]|nr:hypothetical protein [Verrucomicrobiota bacterium]
MTPHDPLLFSTRIPNPRRVAMFVLGFLLFESRMEAQGRIDALLTTGAGSAFVERTVPIFSAGAGRPVILDFDVGFESEADSGVTDEPDSMSVVLIHPDSGKRAVVAYLSPMTLALGPWVVGYQVLDAQSIDVIPGPPLESDPGFVARSSQSHHISVRLPPAFQATALSLLVQLLDNQDDDRSVGWVANATLVPEPSFWALAALLPILRFGAIGFRTSRQRNPLGSSEEAPGCSRSGG